MDNSSQMIKGHFGFLEGVPGLFICVLHFSGGKKRGKNREKKEGGKPETGFQHAGISSNIYLMIKDQPNISI